MKNYVVAIGAILLLTTSCKDYKQELDQANRLNSDLQEQASYKDSTINDFIKTVNEIEGGLNAITEKQDAVSLQANDNETKAQARDRILNNIKEIEQMLQTNKDKLGALQARLAKSGVKIKELEGMIANLNNQIVMRDSSIVLLNGQIGTLNEQVATLNTRIDTLSRQSSDKSEMINSQIAKMNTAYYTKGGAKALIMKKILNEKKGFMGLSKSQKVSGDFDMNEFTQVDITKFNKIDINSKVFELGTAHPSDSYKVNRKGKDMVVDMEITNPEKFWSTSKYLVIITGK